MKVPDGVPHSPNQVCRLRKSLYGLKQASREWFFKLLQELILQGYTQSKNDYSLFTKITGGKTTIVAIYVDDIIVTCDNLVEINDLKFHLHQAFNIKDLVELHYFLGIEVGYVNEGIVLTQRKFDTKLLYERALDISRTAVTPLPLNLKLNMTDGAVLFDPEKYRLSW